MTEILKLKTLLTLQLTISSLRLPLLLPCLIGAKMSGQKGKKNELDTYENGTKFDLLPADEKCDTFRVAFDYYSPRSHFMIVPRDRKAITNFNYLDGDAKLKIVKVAMAMVAHYNLNQLAVLSLHFGKWGTEKNKFHGHLYVDLEEYLRVFKKLEDKIPSWPSPDYVTREWKASRNPRHYELNVRGYPFKNYFREEVEKVKKCRGTNPSTSLSGSSATPSPPFTAILYHPSEPRVGFAIFSGRRRSAETFLEAQEAIVKFASQNNLTNIDAKDENDGCHVCLVLDGKTHGFDLEGSQFLAGYIQVTGLKFYRDLCPHEKREDWFRKYIRMTDYKVYT